MLKQQKHTKEQNNAGGDDDENASHCTSVAVKAIDIVPNRNRNRTRYLEKIDGGKTSRKDLPRTSEVDNERRKQA